MLKKFGQRPGVQRTFRFSSQKINLERCTISKVWSDDLLVLTTALKISNHYTMENKWSKHFKKSAV